MREFGLIGYPLGHSFSASFFARKFEAEGIDAIYRNYPLEHIHEFKNLVKKESGLLGLNVTVPYKQDVIPYLDSLSKTAEALGAVNTISFIRDGGQVLLKGENTDVIGFRQSLEQHVKPGHKAALVLGTGGSSKAIRYVLEQMGIACTMVSRTSGDHQLTYADLDAALMAEKTLIVNTSPLGMHPEVHTFPPIPYETLTPNHLLFDLVYNPAKTQFLSRGEQEGATVVNGSDMLVYQAEASWKIWNNL